MFKAIAPAMSQQGLALPGYQQRFVRVARTTNPKLPVLPFTPAIYDVVRGKSAGGCGEATLPGCYLNE